MDEATGNEFADDLAPPKRGPGRPRKGAATQTTITRRVLSDGEDETETESEGIQSFAALFNSGRPGSDRRVVRVRVYRHEPHEGMLDYITDLDFDENHIKEKWGGSVYKLEGLNEKGQIMKGHTLRIAGDPIFLSEAAEVQWRRSKGLPPKTPAGAAATPGMTPQEIVNLIRETEKEKRDEERRLAQERREEEDRIEERRRKEEREWQLRLETERRAWEERQRKDEAEREERRRKDDAEREDRRRREIAEAEQRRQEHMQQMLLMVQKSSEQALTFMKVTATQQQVQTNPAGQLAEAVKIIATIKDAFGGQGGGEEDSDPIKMLVRSLPDMLANVVPAIGATIREARGTPAQQGIPAAPAVPALPPVITSKMEHLAQVFAARGVDPEQGIAALLGNAAEKLAQAPAQPQQPVTAAPANTNTPAGETRTLPDGTRVTNLGPTGQPAPKAVTPRIDGNTERGSLRIRLA